jgi:pyridoxamine 5'-phosphate oxidase
MDISDIRNDYKSKVLDVKTVKDNPILQLERWLEEAQKAQSLEHNAMTLATSTPDGQPSVRIVLLKQIRNECLYFFTNYRSRKAKELSINPKAAVLFYWPELERQVRVMGHILKADREISDLYFKERPFGSQISAIISPQSAEIENRSVLDELWHEEKERLTGQAVERPDFWGGYMLKPIRFEFWQGRPHRLHDRVVYKKQHIDGWDIVRLAP